MTQTTYKPKKCPSCKNFKCECVTMAESKTTLHDRAKEKLRKKREYLARVGLELQKGTALDPRYYI